MGPMNRPRLQISLCLAALALAGACKDGADTPDSGVAPDAAVGDSAAKDSGVKPDSGPQPEMGVAPDGPAAADATAGDGAAQDASCLKPGAVPGPPAAALHGERSGCLAYSTSWCTRPSCPPPCSQRWWTCCCRPPAR